MLKGLPGNPPVSTMNRDLKALVDANLLIKTGQGRATVYEVAPACRLVHGSIGDSYFDKDLDERKGKKKLDPEVFSHLEKIAIFTHPKNWRSWTAFTGPSQERVPTS